MREQLPLLAKRDWIAGAILWCYQDYKSRRYFWPGQEQGISSTASSTRPAAQAVLLRVGSSTRQRIIDARWTTKCRAARPAAFAFTLNPTDVPELPSYPLTDYRVNWQLVDADNKAFADGGALVNPPGATVRRARCASAHQQRRIQARDQTSASRRVAGDGARARLSVTCPHDKDRRSEGQGRAHHGRELRHWRGAGACFRGPGRKAGAALQLA